MNSDVLRPGASWSEQSHPGMGVTVAGLRASLVALVTVDPECEPLVLRATERTGRFFSAARRRLGVTEVLQASERRSGGFGRGTKVLARTSNAAFASRVPEKSTGSVGCHLEDEG